MLALRNTTRRLRTGCAIVFALLVVAWPLRAQDAGLLSAAPWTTEAVAEGVVLRTAAFEGNLFGSNQYLCVLEVAPGVRFDIVAAQDGKLEKTTALAAKTGAVAAVNGSFFNMRAPYGSVTYLRVDDEVLAPNALSANGPGSGRGHHQKGAVATFKGTLYSLKGDDLERWESDIEAEDVLTTGPVIIAGGVPENLETSSFNTTRHPRTAAGRRADGTVVLVVADGRHAEAAGLSMLELQQVMQALGCRDAINLDGGGSTTMVVRGRIVNHPCDNRKFDPQGERSVANAICIAGHR